MKIDILKYSRLKLTLNIILLMLFIPAFPSICCASPLSIQGSNAFFSKIDQLAAANIQKTDPGIIIAIWGISDKPYIKAYGVSDIESKTPLNVNSKFRIGSITKTFVAEIILQLVDEGKIRLDDKLSTLLPGTPIPYANIITLRNLLNHSSGIYCYTNDDYFINTWLDQPLKQYTPKDILQIALNEDAEFKPGKLPKHSYSNTNYILLGMIIEKKTYNTLSSEINKRIIKPLNLKNTSMPDTPFMDGLYSHGYAEVKNKITDITALNPNSSWAAGGMISDIYDLKVWITACQQGKLISRQMLNEQRTLLKGKEDFDYEYGLGIIKYKNFWGHTGQIPGYYSCAMYNPNRDITLVIMQNNSSGQDLSFKIIDAIDQFLSSPVRK